MHSSVQENPSVRFTVLVTADHSTPVMFGDHSHEPVPLAMAHISDISFHLGAAVIDAVDLGPLQELTQHSKVDDAALEEQAVHAAEKRVVWRDFQGNGAAIVNQAAGMIAGSGGADPVACFDEMSVAQGALGRFPSSELMPLIQQMLSM
jgi:hypothetical protein